jgi:hypothetical protein
MSSQGVMSSEQTDNNPGLCPIKGQKLYLTTHNTHNRQASMAPAGFEPTISAGERPQTYVLDRAAYNASSTV